VEQVFRPPYHPYTESLLMAVPRPARRRELLAAPTSDAALPAVGPLQGCPYALRCPRRIEGLCERVAPPVQALAPGHEIRCHIPADALAESQRDLAA